MFKTEMEAEALRYIFRHFAKVQPNRTAAVAARLLGEFL